MALLAGAVWLWLAVAGPQAFMPTPEGFAAAVVGEDGVLVPFARFDGALWERIWTEPARQVALPSAPDAVPKGWFPPDGRVPAEWFLWLIDDPRIVAFPFEPRAAVRVSVERPVEVDARCLKQVGLQTNHRGTGATMERGKRPKVGVALSVPSVRVEQAAVLDPASAFGKSAAERAVLAFHRSEDDQIEVLDKAQQQRVPPFSVRRAVPVTWRSIVRLGVAQAPARTFYLEGDTQYGAIVMAGHVWIQVDGERETADAEVTFTGEDRREVRHRVPLGVLRVGDQRFWIFETDQWAHESYEIVEVSGRGQRPLSLLDTPGGGC